MMMRGRVLDGRLTAANWTHLVNMDVRAPR